MIDKREILQMAQRMSLQPNVVEKDYVLGWMLAGIAAHDELKDSWVFKGGTCLKKCFFETYRFSEDLDFTLTDEGHLDEAFLKRVFGEIGPWIYERSGIEIPSDKQDFDIHQNPRGSMQCAGKITYRGPVSPNSGGLPRIKLDLLADERLVLAPVQAKVFHPYSDEPSGGISANCYAYEEVFAEKTRALAERTRPRDLYDVINLFRNADARPTASVMLDVLKQKCDHKGIGIPKLADLEPHRESLASAWESMLKHQLPSLPLLDAFWNELPAFFDWLAGVAAPIVPAAYSGGAGERVIRDRVLRLAIGAERQSYLEVIRFAAANRLCVEIDYRSELGERSRRVIEPYSLRQTQKGDIILHTWDRSRNDHRSFRIDRIVGARTTNQTFAPRYAVELSPQGPAHIAPAAYRAPVPRTSFGGFARTPARRAPSRAGGPKYIIQCPVCQKTFTRSSSDRKLNAHKNDWGSKCTGSGRDGYLVDTRY